MKKTSSSDATSPVSCTVRGSRLHKLSVLVPVYNEEKTLEEVVRRVCAFPKAKEIILVDDGSKDRSREILTRLQEANQRAKDPLNHIRIFFQ